MINGNFPQLKRERDNKERPQDWLIVPEPRIGGRFKLVQLPPRKAK